MEMELTHKNAYRLEIVYDLTLSDGHNKIILGNQDVKICRFFRRSYPDVTFNEIKNAKPLALGNKNIITNFECDECNAIFSKYENDMMEFIKLYRVSLNLKGRKGIPKIAKGVNITFDNNTKNLKIQAEADDYTKFANKNGDIIITDKEVQIHHMAKYKPMNIY
jgi:hypothetical protein